MYVVNETLQDLTTMFSRVVYYILSCAAALSCNSGIVQCATRRSEAFGMNRSSSSGGGGGRHHRGRHRHFHYHPHGHHHC
uniref:Uncharacterized protein n=1 Tax=Wuchereria bancrofti TaxID=6293 RepID=A0AAF5PP13_WUCBA